MKEINEKQPEVGDIWINKRLETMCRIIDIKDYKKSTTYVFGTGENLEHIEFGITEFKRRYRYLGKAKNPITSIFEVE